MISIGLMSGTSMDGLDICLSDIQINESDDIEYNIIDFITFSYPQKIKNNIISIINGDDSKIKETDNDLGRFFLEKTILFLNNKEIELISSHGQTISHENKKYSRQIGNPEFLRNYYNVPVYYNFRIDDILNNGTGAPLVPYLDWVLFKNSNVDILAINIGGISNLTYIPRNSSKNMVKGFDMGPGMCLIDLFVRNEWNENFDCHGELSSKGKINKKLLKKFLEVKYIYKSPPKSASVEQFDIKYLKNIIKEFNEINKYDFLRTLVNFTACCIVKNIELFIDTKYLLEDKKIILSGGGVKNKILLKDLKKMLPNDKIIEMNFNGINIDNKESFLMNLLGVTAFKNIPNNMPSVTGADKKVVCGRLYE